MNNDIQIKSQGFTRVIIKRLLTLKEAAQYLSISPRQFEYLEAAGEIQRTSLPDTKKRLYDVFDLDRFIEEAKTENYLKRTG